LGDVPGPASYILCGTPRTGSTLLCSLLSSTGVAGRPESYFREPDHRQWAARFGVPISEDGLVDYSKFATAAARFGSTANGVFAARVMWGTMALIVSGLDTSSGRRSDRDVLERAFGPLRFVHLRRRDVVGQAVSWARAEQSDYWHHGDEVRAQPRLDLGQIDSFVGTIRDHNAAWRSWFDAEAIAPLDVEYESLDVDPGETVREILEWIGTRAPADWTPASAHTRQADEINADWARQYRASRDPRTGC
jgi:LPS sulfotransferase NodH